MRIASLDIGTNTILLLIADVSPEGTFTVLRDEQVIVRLGKGVDEHLRISADAFERALSSLTGYFKLIDEYSVDRIVACGTSALRDAANRDDFVSFIRERLGIAIEVLDSGTEAEVTYRGAVSEFIRSGEEQMFAVLDIGGGSTELTLGTDLSVRKRESLNIGSVRVTERFLKASPPNSLAMSRALKEIRAQAARFSPLATHTRLIGVAGTLTTLAAIDLRLTAYDRTLVGGHTLSFATIQQIFNQLRIKTVDEILSFPQILPGRADIILAGIVILMEVMKKLDVEQITVSDRGLRYGLALREAMR